MADSTEATSQGFRDSGRESLRAWIRLSTSDKIDFFEEMIEIAYRSGALQPRRLALRDLPAPSEGSHRIA